MDLKIFEVIKVIEGNPMLYQIFRSCPYEILHYWDVKNYPAGTAFCKQGEMIEKFYFIVRGAINVNFTGINGKKYNVATHQCGAIIGDTEFLDKRPFLCSVEAITDITVLEIKREYFLKWVAVDRNISSYLIKVLSTKFYEYSLKAGGDLLYPLKVRVCAYLLSRCRQGTHKVSNVEMKVNKEKLSEELAVTSRSIHRVLHDLKGRNIIDVNNDVIIIKDSEKLAAEAEYNKG
jgi:CRP-like cAMP-binding protein